MSGGAAAMALRPRIMVQWFIPLGARFGGRKTAPDRSSINRRHVLIQGTEEPPCKKCNRFIPMAGRVTLRCVAAHHSARFRSKAKKTRWRRFRNIYKSLCFLLSFLFPYSCRLSRPRLATKEGHVGVCEKENTSKRAALHRTGRAPSQPCSSQSARACGG